MKRVLMGKLLMAMLLMATAASAQELPPGPRLLDNQGEFACPVDNWGFPVVTEHEAGRYQVLEHGEEGFAHRPIIRLERDDGSNWCFVASPLGGVSLRVGPFTGPVVTDYTGSGHPNVLIQLYGNGNFCDESTYVVELADEPHFIFRSEYPDYVETMRSHPFDPLQQDLSAHCVVTEVLDLDYNGTLELVTTDSLWTHTLPNRLQDVSRLELPEDFEWACAHKATDIPIVLSWVPGSGYLPVDPYASEPLVPLEYLAQPFQAHLGWYLQRLLQQMHGTFNTTISDPDHQHRCAILGPVLALAFQGDLAGARLLFDRFYSAPEPEFMWEVVMRHLRVSPFVGKSFRTQ